MLKRLVVAVVGLVGVVIIALGVASATLWRADDVLVADLQADEHIVVTDPGVLELAASEVTVRVEADGPVALAVGRDTDVAGWVGTDAHQRVTGLSDWHDLAVEDVAAPTPSSTPDVAVQAPPEGEAPAAGDAVAGEATADGETAPTAPDPTGSDMWVVEASGDGEAEITWTAQPGRWSLLAVSTGQEPPQLSLAWPQVVTTPWLWPCVVVGGLLVLLAAALLVRDVRRGRRGADTDWTPVLTGPLPVVGADGTPVQLTRRQLRELAAHGAATDSGVRAARDARTAGDPVPDEAVRAGSARGAATSRQTAGDQAARTDGDTAVAGSAPGSAGTTGAVAGTGARRALRELTPFGSPSRDDAGQTDEHTRPVAAGRAAAPGSAVAGAPPGGTRQDAGSTVASRPDGTPWGWSPRGTGTDGATSPVAGRARPGDGTRAPDGTSVPVTRADGGHPHGRPAWLGPVPPERTSDGPVLPPPGPASSSSRGPDVPDRAAPALPAASAGPAVPARPAASARPAGPAPSASPGADRQAGAAGARGPARPGWTPAPPAPGAVAGPASGPDAPRPVPSRGPGRGPGPGGGGSAGRSPSPSVPGRPTSGTAPHPEAPRPAWLRDAPVPGGPRAGSAVPPEQAAGSRADAWRRAWGLPSTDDDPTSEEER